MKNQRHIIILAVIGLILLSITVQADTTKLVNPANGHSYQRFDAQVPWTVAKDNCSGLAGYLVTITSQAEQDWIYNSHLMGVQVFLGALENSDGTWQWITGEPFNYTHWASGYPLNDSWSLKNPFTTDYGYWTNIHYTYGESKAYICEWNSNLYKYLGSTTVSDVNMDGLLENVLLATKNNSYYILIYNGATGKLLKSVVLGTTSQISGLISITTTDDVSGDGFNDIAILYTNSDGTHSLQLRNGATLAIIKTVVLDSTAIPISPISLNLATDFNKDGYREIEIVFSRLDGTNSLQLRNGLTLGVLKTFALPKQ